MRSDPLEVAEAGPIAEGVGGGMESGLEKAKRLDYHLGRKLSDPMALIPQPGPQEGEVVV